MAWFFWFAAWGDGNMAESAGQLVKIVEHINQSNQPMWQTASSTLYLSSSFSLDWVERWFNFAGKTYFTLTVRRSTFEGQWKYRFFQKGMRRRFHQVTIELSESNIKKIPKHFRIVMFCGAEAQRLVESSDESHAVDTRKWWQRSTVAGNAAGAAAMRASASAKRLWSTCAGDGGLILHFLFISLNIQNVQEWSWCIWRKIFGGKR